ncbi:sensor histidine kinase [Paucisalibacillus globulus]|uniref:sensor histidine kinase n=1 Tax=Paucisalibacillus globulus TaxID=351095 RepID=UPI000BB8A2EA|nr:HAMP domain-containing sensor histidine kinase [Paucisalibacillus globulus]
MKKNDNHISIMIGSLLVMLGILLPTIVESSSTYMIENMEASILLRDSGKLVIISILYVAKYTMIFFFIFFGGILVIHGKFNRNGNLIWQLLYALTILLILFIYNYLHKEGFSYIGILLTLAILLFIQGFIPRRKNFYLIYSVLLFIVLLAMSWMQLIPWLSKFGIGTNDIATSLKIADHYLTGNYLLNTLASLFFILFLIISVILTFLLNLLNKRIIAMEKIQEGEQELKAARIALVESKLHEEINSLVHDLKTPLTTMEGLSSLIKMRLEKSGETSIKNYLERMGSSIQKMNDMISEILYEHNKQPISIKELLEYVTSHLILAEQNIEIVVNLEGNLPPICVNKIRFSRAISNLLENAISSMAGKAGSIHVNVNRVDKHIVFRIIDNGQGIKTSHLHAIWDEGFSTRNSSGIGLSFVKSVVENHHGTIQVSSVPGSHTQMNIILPIHEEGEKAYEYNNLSR